MLALWSALIIFALVYVAIILEKADRALVAIIGAALTIALGIVPQKYAFAAVDLNVIFLLMGMMTIVWTSAKSGMFEWLAITLARLAKGKPFQIMLFIGAGTAALSAILDNVTTVLLISPIILLICERLDIDAVPFLAVEILASNIGGTATLIGDPPNIIIGSATGLSFNQFIVNLAPPIFIVGLLGAAFIWLVFGKKMRVSRDVRARIMDLDPKSVISDYSMLHKSIIVIALVLVGFFLHDILGVEPATIALAGSAILALITKVDVTDMFAAVEWRTLLFLMGLFMLVSALENVGALKIAANALLRVTKGNELATNIVILWGSAGLSAFLDNIPFVATMVPLIKNMGGSMHLEPLWWSLALGACLGGNSTIIGASAGVVVSDIARRAGHPISFKRFLSYGIPTVLLSLIVSSAYIYLRYLR